MEGDRIVAPMARETLPANRKGDRNALRRASAIRRSPFPAILLRRYTIMKAICSRTLLGIGLVAVASGVDAAPRTFVSTLGNDANPCSLASPCRAFQAAINAVDAGGEVVALDSGGYGTMVITKSVTVIVPPGVHAAITANGVDGVYVNAPGIAVALRGLYLSGTGTVGHGIRYKQGTTLHIENCVINGFSAFGYAGISHESGGDMFVKDTIARNNGTGIGIAPFSAAITSLDRVRVENNSGGGIEVGGPAHVTVRDSVSAHNTSSNFSANAPSSGGINTYLTIENSAAVGSMFGIAAGAGGVTGSSYVSVVDSVVAYNTSYGLAASTNGVIVVANSTVTQNATGLLAGSGGIIRSYSNNRVFNNTVNGTPTNTLTPM
jgi:hypothetical protein